LSTTGDVRRAHDDAHDGAHDGVHDDVRGAHDNNMRVRDDDVRVT
jgi:hypothetical protein